MATLYQPTAEQVQAWRRASRKVEKLLERKGGSFLDPVFALAKVNETIASAEPITFTDELTLHIPALPRPTLAELREKFSWIREENGIERDTSPTGAVTLKLGTVLREGEPSIGGAEYERRIAPKLDIVLGYQQAVWLVEHQDEFPKFMALLGKVYIDFTGLVVVHAYGHRHFPCLYEDGERWHLRWHWIDLDFYSSDRLAVSSK